MAEAASSVLDTIQGLIGGRAHIQLFNEYLLQSGVSGHSQRLFLKFVGITDLGNVPVNHGIHLTIGEDGPTFGYHVGGEWVYYEPGPTTFYSEDDLRRLV